MRALTDAEGRVIAVLLGTATASERERLRRIQVPRSTYHAARKRAYEEGWIRDRYIPDPARFGAPIATVSVFRPFADRVTELTQRLEADPSTVLAWVGGQSVLAVGLFPSESAAALSVRSTSGASLASATSTVIAHIDRSELPVYFDYEGLWSHLSELPGAIRYPAGLGGLAAPGDGEARPATPHQIWAATELVHRPLEAEAAGRPGHLLGPFGLPFSQQRLLRSGWIAYRVLLEPSRVPPYRGRSADQVIFITGALRPGASPAELFATLTRDCRVFPFLYACDGLRLVLGALGRPPAVVGGDASPAADTERRPVMSTLQAALQGIEVVQEPATMFRTVVDHRYDRLLRKDGAAGSVGRSRGSGDK